MEINKLKKSQVVELVDKLSFFYGSDLEFLKSYNFYYNENNKKVHISSINIGTVHLDISRLSSVGMYFGTFHDEVRFRLSIEGANLLSDITRNYAKLKEEFLGDYLSGENISTKCFEKINWEDNSPFLIVICGDETFGSISIKDGHIFNYIPKARRVSKDKLF